MVFNPGFLDRRDSAIQILRMDLEEKSTSIINFQNKTERFDRFSDMVIVGRTRDTERVGELERRVETLERQVFGGTPPPRG